jgi:histidinol dehydrogenase
VLTLDIRDADFERHFDTLVNARREADADVSRDVAAMLARVKAKGDAALADYTARFDGHDLYASGWRVEPTDCRAALDALAPELRRALELAAERITIYHEKQRPADRDEVDASGVRIGARWTPVEAAGLYVPGGRAAYPSSLLMNAIPAKVAGVRRLAMVTPTPGGEVNPLVLAAAALVGIEEIWRVGGAQAVGALAYGTERIAPVDVIVGPGNAWVAEAKRQLYGVVGIDMVAGPSEILVVADAANDPEWIAADLLSQAEHDPTSQSILLDDLSSAARTSWDTNGAVILVERLIDAAPLIDRLAPEHLELAAADPEPLFRAVRHAGSIFLGRHTPEAIGDYLGGPNHVLPTGRRARFASGLSVLDFMKRTSFLGCSPEALAALGPAAVALAEAEGLPAHARSVAIRLTPR